MSLEPNVIRLPWCAAHTYTHTNTHAPDVNSCVATLLRHKNPLTKEQIINMKHPNSQIPTSTSLPLLEDFLQASSRSQSVNTAALWALHERIPRATVRSHILSPLTKKSRASSSIFVSGSRGLRGGMASPSISLSQPIHNSHSPTGNSFAPETRRLSAGVGRACVRFLRGAVSYRGWELLINKYALYCGRCEQDFHIDL